jgi:hypothetical protein
MKGRRVDSPPVVCLHKDVEMAGLDIYTTGSPGLSDKIRDGMDSPAQRSSEDLSEVAGVETRGGQIFVFTPPRYAMGVWTEAVKFECSLPCLQNVRSTGSQSQRTP